MIPSRGLLVATLVVAGMVAAGCSGSHHSKAAVVTTSATTATTTSPATSVTTAPVGPTAPAANPTSTTPAGVTSCASDMLSAALTNGNGAAGTIFYHLVLSNTSSRTCTLQGFAGVSFVDRGGRQIGASVPRDTASNLGGLVTVAPGSSAGAVFALHDAYVGSANGCQPTMATGLRVYPPNQTAALFVPTPLQVCTNPATPGSATVTQVTNLANLPG